MQDKKKSKAQLLEELDELRRQVAETKAGEREIEEGERTFGRDGLILDGLAEIILYQDIEGRILWANKAATDTFGLTLDQIKGRACYDLCPMRPEPCPKCPVREALRIGDSCFVEMHAPTGKWWDVRGYPVKDASGKVKGTVEVALNITTRKQAQDGLLKSEQRYRLIIEHASDAIFQIDLTGRIIEANRAACDSLGRTRDELLNMSVSQIDLDWDHEKLTPFLEALATGEIKTIEGTHLRKNGTTFPVEIRVTKIEIDESPVILALVRDITQRRRIESALIESEQALKAELEAETPTADSIHVSGIGMKWNLKDGTCSFDKLPVAMMWIESTLAGLISGAQSMVGAKRFALALQSQGRKSVEDDWQVISQFPDFKTGFKAIANIAAVAGWGDWNIVSIDREKKECLYRVYNSWEGRCQKALGVSWGSGLAAGKFAGYTSMLFKTNCWADQTAFLAEDDEYDEFLVHQSDRSLEQEIENLLVSDQATRADMAVALQKLRKEIEERTAVEKRLRESEERYRNFVANSSEGIYRVDLTEPVPINLPEGKIAELISKNAVAGEVNEALAEMYGYTPDQMIGRRVTDLTPDYGHRVIGIVRSENHRVAALETVDYDKNGQPVYLSESFSGVVKNGLLYRIWGVQRNITERKWAEERLRESEEKYRDLYETAMVGLYRSRISDGKLIAANQALADLGGYDSPEEMTEKEFFAPEYYADTNKREELMRLLHEKGRVDDFEFTGIKPDGSQIEIAISATMYPEKGYLEGAVVDITDRKRAEEALRQSEEKYRRLVETMAEGLCIANSDYVFTYVNPTMTKMVGYNSSEMVGHHISEFVHEDDKTLMEEQIRLRKKGIAAPYDLTWVSKQGHKVHTITSPHALLDSKDNFIGSFGVITDITERKRTEHELMRSREMLQNVLDTIPARVFWKDCNSVFLGCNTLFAHDAGKKSPEGLIGKTDYDMPWTKEEADFFREHDRRVIESDTPEYHIIEPQLHADGTHAWLDTSKVPLHNENGTVVGILGTYEDITERRLTEDKLRASQEQLSLAFEAASDGLWDLNINTGEAYFSPRYYKMLGYLPSEFEPSYDAWASLIHPEDRRDAEAKLQECIQRKADIFETEFRLKTKNGSYRWILTRGKVVARDEEDRPLRIVGTHVDITERKQAEEERKHLLKALAAKNDELESIVYVSSHDLRSPLVNIQGFSGELHRSCDHLTSVLEQTEVSADIKETIIPILETDIPTSLGYISNSASKMDLLLRGLLKLSRLGSIALKIRELNMNTILRAITKNMQYQINRSGARITIEKLPPCLGDASQISQVFTNLLDNAIKYRHPTRSSKIRVSGSIEDGMAVYRIEDNGIGIARDHIEKVFEIFHRLDPHSKVAGEGLGLTIARRILDLMDGSIRVESKPGKGSSFFVSLPAAEK